MRSTMKRVYTTWTIFVLVLLSVSESAYAQAGVKTQTGAFADGATFLIEVPANWNGTLLLYSHGYVPPGSTNPPQDVGDPLTRFFLLSNGYALAGSSYATTGWAIHEALPDQIAVLDTFAASVGHPSRTIAWGHSLGGIISAGLIQRFPERFDAALPMCGVLGGGVGIWNQGLDTAFAFKTLLASGSPLNLTGITNPLANLGLAEQLLSVAQQTSPQARARIALAAALADTPGWFIPTSPEPAASDLASRETNQFLWLQQVGFPFLFAFRADLEARAGGNPSWNTGVNYEVQLAHSADRNEVRALYKEAGLNLDADLEALNQASRIKANESAVDYLEQNLIFNGQIGVPVLTLHTSGDGLVSVQNERAYKHVVREAGNNSLLRETFVHRAGHCTFTPAETITALENLIVRLDTGKWSKLEPATLNNTALALGPSFNVFFLGQNLVPTDPEFFEFKPSQYLRPFDALAEVDQEEGPER